MVISLITQTSFGIWNIPMRGQNFINAQYAQKQDLEISSFVSEGILFHNFNMLESVIKDNLEENPIIIFCSLLQLSYISEKRKASFLKFFSKFELHFALELISGKGIQFLEDIVFEASYFSKVERIDVNVDTYEKFYKKYKNSTDYL
tara:strand:+ start:575 stop:1015 length:441 start_codon:yes stop_codon:yes gene_type:complete